MNLNFGILKVQKSDDVIRQLRDDLARSKEEYSRTAHDVS